MTEKEKEKQKEKLIALFMAMEKELGVICDCCSKVPMETVCERIADYMIANNIMIAEKKEKEKQKEKPETDLAGKRGSCAYAEPVEKVFGNSKCYVRCISKEHREKHCKRIASDLRQRTAKACKAYCAESEEAIGKNQTKDEGNQ